MGKKERELGPVFDLFAQEHFLSIHTEEIKVAIWAKILATVQEATDIADFYYKPDHPVSANPRRKDRSSA